MDKLLGDSGIDPKSFNYEKDSEILTFDYLKGIDMGKAFKEYAKEQQPILDISKAQLIFGKDAIQENGLKHFSKYKNLQKYQVMFKEQSYTCNTRLFCEEIDKYLKSKRPNCKIMYKSEVEEFIFDEKKHFVKAIKLRGVDQPLECDAVVLCAGSFIARMVKDHFGLVCPVVPVKGYTFDIPTDLEPAKLHLAFKDIAFVAVMFEPGKWRIAGFGDMSG